VPLDAVQLVGDAADGTLRHVVRRHPRIPRAGFRFTVSVGHLTLSHQSRTT